jgi:hypothetical protein
MEMIKLLVQNPMTMILTMTVLLIEMNSASEPTRTIHAPLRDPVNSGFLCKQAADTPVLQGSPANNDSSQTFGHLYVAGCSSKRESKEYWNR